MSADIRFVAIEDSFTEGVGDELPDGTPRGWADLTAEGWARSLGEPIEYANLAIRGKLAWPVVEQQLEPALALKPTHLSFNGGGNDMLRGIDAAQTRANLDAMLAELKKRGIPVVLTGMVAAPNMGPDYARKFNPIYPELATKYGTSLYPFILDNVVGKPELMLGDHIHPNAEGVKIVAAGLAPLVEDALPNSR